MNDLIIRESADVESILALILFQLNKVETENLESQSVIASLDILAKI